jgi:hypothetical protein
VRLSFLFSRILFSILLILYLLSFKTTKSLKARKSYV